MKLTPREWDVVEALAGGARSYGELARSLEPPVSWRTAEAHVIAINAKLRAEFEPKLAPHMRVLVWVLLEHCSENTE